MSNELGAPPGGGLPAGRTALRWPDGSPSARSLLLTLLGEWVLPAGGAVWTGTVVEALGLLGVPEAAARQALARSANRNLLTAERRGRRTRWSLTGRAERLLAEGAERIYGFGAGRRPWDGAWLLVLVSVPEHNRHLRARLRTRMAWHGFGPLSPGAWLSPWADREAAVTATLDELGLTAAAVSWIGRPGELGAITERVPAIWDLDAVAREYGDFVTATEATRPTSPGDAFAAVTRLVHDWRRFPGLDPGLPAPLLPASWPAATAASAFHDAHRAWHPAAAAWWADHGRP